jgi:hypothetical protein
VGKPVEVQAWNDRILIFQDSHLIVSHPRCDGKYRVQIDKEHYSGIFYGEETASVRMLAFDHRFSQNGDEVEVRDLALYDRIAEGGTQ